MKVLNPNQSSEIRVALTVTYYLYESNNGTSKPTVLGVESYTNINEILLPDSSNANITITCYFDGHGAHRWIVKSVAYNGNDVSVHLTPRNTEGEIFLTQTMKRVRQSAMQLLRFGTIVEVDFGFKPTVYKGTGTQTTAKRYPDVVQNLELYKRRPAIVLKATRRGVQVVPLTSQEPDDYATNSSIFKLSEKSLSLCTQLKKGSYVLSHFIQTIGYSRILPPLSTIKSRQSQRIESYTVRICSNDEKKLRTALAHNVGLGNYFSIKESMNENMIKVNGLTADNEKLNATVSELMLENDFLKNEFEKIQQEHATLRELLKDQYIRAKICNISDADALIDGELAEFMEITALDY